MSYENLICEYNHSNEIELIDLEFITYSTDFKVFSIEKVLFKEYHAKNNYKKLIIKSKTINQWLGFTNMQRNLSFEIKERLFNQHKELFRNLDFNSFKLNIYYEINTNQDTFNGIITYTYLPYIEISFDNSISFYEIEKFYFELLDLFYLLLEFNLDIETVVFQSEGEPNNNSYFYYKTDYEESENKTIYIALANDLFEQYREELDLKVFQHFFQLDKYNKSFFNAFRKYKMFHYSEEKLLGYFRILENLMFENDKLFTEELLNIYIENVNLSQDEKNKEKELLIGKLKPKSVINTPLKKRKEKIKFIILHYNILNILPQKYKLIIDFKDVEKIVKLRNNITHFDNYTISQNELEKYIDYLEFLTNYILLKLIDYSDESFINNLGFYPLNHRVFDFER